VGAREGSGEEVRALLVWLVVAGCGGSVTDDPEPEPYVQTCVGAVLSIPCSDGAPHPDCGRCPDGWLVRECEGANYVERCER